MDRFIAFISLDSDGDEPPFIYAVVDPTQESSAFTDLNEAIAWARERSQRVLVRVHHHEWSAGPEPVEDVPAMTEGDHNAAVATVAEEFERYTAESTTSQRPRAWYLAILNPDVAGPLGPAEALVRQLAAVDHLDRLDRGDEVLWVIECQARSKSDVESVEGLIARTLWPDERLAAEFGEGSFMFGSGDQQRIGLAEYKHHCDLLR